HRALPSFPTRRSSDLRRQLDVRECAFATRLDRELKDSVQFVFWNHERPAPVLVTLQERSLTRKFRFELGEDFLEMRFKKPGCNRSEEHTSELQSTSLS